MNPSHLIGLTFALLLLAYFTARVAAEWLADLYRTASRDMRCFQRTENVYPKFKHTPQ